jgi:peptidoglycan/LPS O-acetylase OafA/YrhL
VVLPALLLTLLLEGAAYLHAPAVYRVFSDPFPWGAVPAELLQTATFTVGWWNWGATPLSNGPFWSLSFECVYYALYGLIVYAPRARWVLVPLLLLAVGPAIALLFPVWLFGVVLYELYLRLSARRFGPGLAAAVLLAYAGVLFAFRRPILQFLQQTTVGERATALTAWVASYGWGRTMFHGATLHWLDRFSISYFLTGSVLVALMLPLLLALDRYLPQVSRRVAGWIRMVADSTFTLYLLHLPLFIFVVTMLRAPLRGWREGLLLLAFAIVLSMGLAMLFDRLKNAMRAGLRRRSPAIAVRSS